MLRRLFAYIRGIARRRSIAREVDAELQFHLRQQIMEHIAHGISPDEARRLALRDLGGLSQTRDSVRDVRTVWFDALWQDLRFVIRRLRRERGFTLTALFTLTLAVGANTAILSVADAVLFRPLPYADPDNVFVIEVMNRQSGARSAMTPYAFIDFINDLEGVVSKVAMTGAGPRVVVPTPDGPLNLPTLGVSAGYFQTLGVMPALGRLFDDQDAGREGRSAMLSYSAWRERFGGDETIIGKPVTIGNTAFDIVGVLPQGFIYPSLFTGKPEVITELKPVPRGTTGGVFHSIVRLAPGISREQAQARIESALLSVTARDREWRESTAVLENVRSVLYGAVSSPIMRFLLVSAGLILLIGCANLANMLLVRGRRHMRETAIALALGAGRGRQVRPILMEAVIIAFASGGAAILATATLFDLLLHQVPPAAYGNAPVGVNLRVGVIALGLSLASAVAFALMPAWRAARLDVAELLRRRVGDRERVTWLGRPMLIVQVALSVVAVSGAVMAARAFVSVLNVPLGFSADRVVRITVAPPRPAANSGRVVSVKPGVIELADPPRPAVDSATFYMRIVEALKAHPDVMAAGASTGLPLSNEAPYDAAKLRGSQERANVGIEYVVRGFFETLEMPIVRGRSLSWDDLTADRTAAVISEAAARTMFRGSDPLGQTFVDGADREFHVVGIVRDVRQSIDRTDLPRAYVFSGGRGILSPVVRLRARNDAAIAELKNAVRAVAPDSFVTAEWWSDSINGVTAYRNPRFQTIMLGGLGFLALALSALGVFGVVNYVVVSRTREMGVRVALGASPRSLVGFVMRGAFMPVIAGLVSGLLCSRLFGSLAEAQLFKVDTHDPSTVVIAGATVALAALAAAYLPARRAAAVDPVAALRIE